MIPRRAVAVIKHFEGFHRVVHRSPVVTAVPYLCPAGYWTIGYGILCQKDHPPITEEEGEQQLMAVLPSYVNHAVAASPILLREDEDKLAAITSFVFNLGPTRYRASTLRRRVNERNWLAAGQEIEKWVYGGGRKLPGLVRRRAVEKALLLGTR